MVRDLSHQFALATTGVHLAAAAMAAIGWAVVYALAFVAVVLFLASLRFRSKDLR